MLCPKCCNYIPDDSLICPDCGNPIPEDTRQRAVGGTSTIDYTDPMFSSPPPDPVKPREKGNISAKGCMTFAIFTFIFFSKLCGGIAWAYASHVIESNNEGDIADAIECREKSKRWSIAGLCICLIGNFILFLVLSS